MQASKFGDHGWSGIGCGRKELGKHEENVFFFFFSPSAPIEIPETGKKRNKKKTHGLVSISRCPALDQSLNRLGRKLYWYPGTD